MPSANPSNNNNLSNSSSSSSTNNATNNINSSIIDKNKDNVESLDDTLKKSFHNTVHAAVEATNSVLATLERTTKSIQQPIVHGLHTIRAESEHLSCQTRQLYERRLEYGPYLVIGSATLVGGLTAMRRGKLPGALAATAVGGLTYVSLFEPYRFADLAETITGNNNNRKDE